MSRPGPRGNVNLHHVLKENHSGFLVAASGATWFCLRHVPARDSRGMGVSGRVVSIPVKGEILSRVSRYVAWWE
jgi:hypothetical protein